MSDTLITIIAIFLAIFLLFIIPLISMTEKSNDISQNVAQTLVADFVHKSATTGLIRLADINALRMKLDATGNTWDITIEVRHLDENPGKKPGGETSFNMIGENLTYSTFTVEIMDSIEGNERKEYPLKKGDEIIVSVKNTNKTMAESFRTWMYKVVGEQISEMSATSSAMVINSGPIINDEVNG